MQAVPFVCVPCRHPPARYFKILVVCACFAQAPLVFKKNYNRKKTKYAYIRFEKYKYIIVSPYYTNDAI
jgi:hypothetical protein